MLHISSSIFLAADHAGYDLKGELVKFLKVLGYSPIDLGTHTQDRIDYPDIASILTQKILQQPSSMGIALCGTGIGISIACNRHQGIRAAVVVNPEMAQLARAHNDANILCLGARLIDLQMAQKCAKVFFATSFEGGRHTSRIQKLDGFRD